MEWLTAIRHSIDYIEEHLAEDISANDAAEEVAISPYIFCKGFAVMTGSSVSEYIRGRRLYLAAKALRDTDKSVLDAALDSCYDTPESFTKAFTRFHGATPSAVRVGAPFKTFLPFRIQVTVQGGNQMDCKITKMAGMKLAGFQKEFSNENSYEEIPKFWDEILKKDRSGFVGEYAVCVDDVGGGKFRYIIAGKCEGDSPEGMVLYEFPAGEWAVFDCVGPIPEAFQTLNTRIFKEWLPGNAEFELSGGASVEWYDVTGDMSSPDYHSSIWIPVKRK